VAGTAVDIHTPVREVEAGAEEEITTGEGEITTGEGATITNATTAAVRVDTTWHPIRAAMPMDRAIAVQAATTITGETGIHTPAATTRWVIEAEGKRPRKSRLHGICAPAGGLYDRHRGR